MREVHAPVLRVRTLALRMEHVEVVAADAPHHLRHHAPDLVALAQGDVAHVAQDVEHALRRAAHLAFRREPRFAAVGEDRVDRVHVVHHVAVRDRARAAGVVARHAPDRALRGRADVHGEPHALRPQPGVERIQHDAGLDGDRHRPRVEVEHAVEVLAVIDHQRRADGLPALRAARAARQHRHLQVAAHRKRRTHVVHRARHEHADGLDLVDRRIRRVPSARSGVEQHLPLDFGAQTTRELGVAGRGVEDQRLRQRCVHLSGEGPPRATDRPPGRASGASSGAVSSAAGQHDCRISEAPRTRRNRVLRHASSGTWKRITPARSTAASRPARPRP